VVSVSKSAAKGVTDVTKNTVSEMTSFGNKIVSLIDDDLEGDKDAKGP